MEKIIFRTMFNNPYGVVGQDLSREVEDVFIEIPPYSKDSTGKFLNDTSVPVLKPNGKVNIQERIQSYEEEVNIYKILEKFALTGDESVINRSVGSYGDISKYPTNYNDFQNMVLNDLEAMRQLPSEIRNLVLADDLSNTDVESKIKAYYDSLKATKEANKVVKEEVKPVEKEGTK